MTPLVRLAGCLLVLAVSTASSKVGRSLTHTGLEFCISEM